LIKFDKYIECSEFNKSHAKNRKVKAKVVNDDIYEKNDIKEVDFLTLSEIGKKGEKNMYRPSKE
jgi:hypothetical protein